MKSIAWPLVAPALPVDWIVPALSTVTDIGGVQQAARVAVMTDGIALRLDHAVLLVGPA